MPGGCDNTVNRSNRSVIGTVAKGRGSMKKKKRNLTTIIFIALILGAAAGLALNLWAPQGYVRDEVIVNGIFYVIGQGFIRLMQMLVVPLVFCSLVCGSMAIGDTRRLGKVGYEDHCFLSVDHGYRHYGSHIAGKPDQSGDRAGYGEDRDYGNCCGGKAEHGGYPASNYPNQSAGGAGKRGDAAYHSVCADNRRDSCCTGEKKRIRFLPFSASLMI